MTLTDVIRCAICEWAMDSDRTTHSLCVPGTRFVRVLRQEFTDADIHDGDIDYQSEDWEEVNCVPDEFDSEDGLTAIDLAVKVLRDAGTAESGGMGSFYDPDHSFTANYYTGLQIATSAFLVGFTADEESAIVRALDS